MREGYMMAASGTGVDLSKYWVWWKTKMVETKVL